MSSTTALESQLMKLGMYDALLLPKLMAMLNLTHTY